MLLIIRLIESRWLVRHDNSSNSKEIVQRKKGSKSKVLKDLTCIVLLSNNSIIQDKSSSKKAIKQAPKQL
ncbi:hypothetical protein BJX99DRAFT_228630, partial [Aspergillus californicus]